MPGPLYQKAHEALQAAHDACYSHPDRPVHGMTHGPFSGVNVALGIVDKLERENTELREKIARKEEA